MSEEHAILVCVPDDGTMQKVEGSLTQKAACGHDVLIAPSSRSLLESGKSVELICIPCVSKDPVALKSIKEEGAHITPEQRTELNEVLGVDFVDQGLARLGINERPWE